MQYTRQTKSELRVKQLEVVQRNSSTKLSKKKRKGRSWRFYFQKELRPREFNPENQGISQACKDTGKRQYWSYNLLMEVLDKSIQHSWESKAHTSLLRRKYSTLKSENETIFLLP